MSSSDVPAPSPQEALEKARRPASPLAGPYGHPIHAALVPVPIGAWSSAFFFDLRSQTSPSPQEALRAARATMGIGIAGAVGAAMFGVLDWMRLTPKTRASAYGTTHMVLNLTVLAHYLVAFGRRHTLATRSGRLALADLLAHAAALSLLGISGALGGELSYRYGVRVAGEATQLTGHMVKPAT